MADYYEIHERTAEELAFERRYNSLEDKGIMDYVHDLISSLTDEGLLDNSDTVRVLELSKRS